MPAAPEGVSGLILAERAHWLLNRCGTTWHLTGNVCADPGDGRPSRTRRAPDRRDIAVGGIATLTVYVVGSIAQVIVMLACIAGEADHVDAGSVAYVLAFMLAAAGFGILGPPTRAGLGTRVTVIGACAAPLAVGNVLLILPAILSAVGLLSAS